MNVVRKVLQKGNGKITARHKILEHALCPAPRNIARHKITVPKKKDASHLLRSKVECLVFSGHQHPGMSNDQNNFPTIFVVGFSISPSGSGSWALHK